MSPEDFNGQWKIVDWETEDPRYSRIVKVGTPLTISEDPERTFSLRWSDGVGVYTLDSLTYADGTLRLGASRLRRSDQDPGGIRLAGASVRGAAGIDRAVAVSLAFGDGLEGPRGTFTAEADPPPPPPEGSQGRLRPHRR